MRTDIETRINEAEVCRSMGLYGDSLSIYESILAIVSPQETQVQDKIQKRINLLRKEIEKLDKVQTPGISAKELSVFKKTFSGRGDVFSIFDGASAFKEMGLYAEAVAEYAKMLTLDYPKKKIIPPMAESLLKANSPDKAVKEFEKLVEKKKLAKKESSQVKFLLGQEMEKRDHRDQAHDLYEAALKMNPSDVSPCRKK